MTSYISQPPPSQAILGFNAEVTNSKALVDTLAGIHNGKSDQHTLCTVDEEGISFKVHDLGNNIQGLATFGANLFRDFVLDQGLNEIEFKINVSTVLKCLNIYGANAGGQTCTIMEYDEENPDFRLLLQTNTGSTSNISTQCRIKTLAESEQSFNASNDLFIALRDSDNVGQAVIFSDALSDAFCEIYSLPGAATVSLLMSPVAPFFQLSAKGTTGECTIDFPKGSESFKTFQCQRTIRHQYQLLLIQDALKVLPTAHQTNIQMSDNGLLCFQHRLQHKGGEVSYVEFVILPDEEEDSDEDADDDEDERRQQQQQQQLPSKKRRRNETRHDRGQATNASELFDDEENDEDDDDDHEAKGSVQQEHGDNPFQYNGEEDDEDDDRRGGRGSGRDRGRDAERRVGRRGDGGDGGDDGGEDEVEDDDEDSDSSIIGPSDVDDDDDDDDDEDTQPEQ
jgi:hypothetical protein